MADALTRGGIDNLKKDLCQFPIVDGKLESAIPHGIEPIVSHFVSLENQGLDHGIDDSDAYLGAQASASIRPRPGQLEPRHNLQANTCRGWTTCPISAQIGRLQYVPTLLLHIKEPAVHHQVLIHRLEIQGDHLDPPGPIIHRVVVPGGHPMPVGVGPEQVLACKPLHHCWVGLFQYRMHLRLPLRCHATLRPLQIQQQVHLGVSRWHRDQLIILRHPLEGGLDDEHVLAFLWCWQRTSGRLSHHEWRWPH
mmetsp:Transcript_95550/g.255489  ORF Transcript_95550/g.255489 Transcript_95550/m.255489 type:complete len:251 (+) Transcript_95550:319-1071(+)